jgi:hypothetical protein
MRRRVAFSSSVVGAAVPGGAGESGVSGLVGSSGIIGVPNNVVFITP